MAQFEVTAPKANRKMMLEYQIPEGLGEKVELFGERLVNDAAGAKIAIIVQDMARKMLMQQKSEGEIQAFFDGYKPVPGTRRGRSTAKGLERVKEQAVRKLKSMTPEQVENYIQEIRNRLAAGT